MTFQSQLSVDLAVFYDTDEWATAMTYTPPGGDAVAVTGVIFYGAGPDDHMGADALGSSAKIRVRVSEVATMEVDATFTVGSDVFEVLYAKLSTLGLEWVCEVAKQS
jgi:hypothetical protein